MEEFKETNDDAVEICDEEEEEVLVPLPCSLCVRREMAPNATLVIKTLLTR
jgi:hypothetical protein